MCSLAPILGEVEKHENIRLRTLSEVVGISGHAGDFIVKIKTGPIFIDPDRCTSCGKCVQECKVNVDDEWNADLIKRKAVYRPFAQSVPNTFSIDPDACVKCKKCEKVCTANAIDLSRTQTAETVHAGAIIIATGHEELDPEKKLSTVIKNTMRS